MNVPRLRISWLMILVAFLAVDFAALRALAVPHGQFGDLFVVGIVPLLNALSICGLVARFRPQSRPFVLGFSLFAAVAFVCYIIGSATFTSTLHHFVGAVMMAVLTPFRGIVRGPSVLIYLLASVIVMLPQLLFAWLGGTLSAKYRLAFIRRGPRTPKDTAPVEALVESSDS